MVLSRTVSQNVSQIPIMPYIVHWSSMMKTSLEKLITWMLLYALPLEISRKGGQMPEILINEPGAFNLQEYVSRYLESCRCVSTT